MNAANQSDQIVNYFVNVLKTKKYGQLWGTEIDTNQSFVGIFARNKKSQKTQMKNTGPYYVIFEWDT